MMNINAKEVALFLWEGRPFSLHNFKAFSHIIIGNNHQEPITLVIPDTALGELAIYIFDGFEG